MPRARRPVVLPTLVPAILLASWFVVVPGHETGAQTVAAAADTRLRITYPAEGTLFPPESVAPTVVWTDDTGRGERWRIVVRDGAGAKVLTAAVDAPRWRQSEDDWKRFK